jgi:REP element-mobilizing transposase RayT
VSTHTQHTKTHVVYFCTFACYRWLSLFEEANAYEAVYDWFNHLEKNGCKITGYVIMPNHLHVLIYPTNPSTSLNKLVANGKRFMAYAIVKKLKDMKKIEVLNLLSSGVQKNEKEVGKKHQVFRLSFDARECFNEKILEQKLQYIHHNPVQGRWQLSKCFIDYIHSSALFYEAGVQRSFNVIHYKDLG